MGTVGLDKIVETRQKITNRLRNGTDKVVTQLELHGESILLVLIIGILGNQSITALVVQPEKLGPLQDGKELVSVGFNASRNLSKSRSV